MLILLGLAILLGGPTALAVTRASDQAHWSQMRWDSAGLAPDPATHPGAIVQVYAARSWGWRGAFSVHSWVVFKPEGASSYERYDVVGWGVGPGGRAAVRKNIRTVDGYWAGNKPEVIGELRGAEGGPGDPQAARGHRRLWLLPGIPHVAGAQLQHLRGLRCSAPCPSSRSPMPANAVGKDWLPLNRPVASTPSGTGIQVSLWGLLGVAAGIEEGLEVNVLGLVLGVDPKHLAVKLPGFGSVGLQGQRASQAAGQRHRRGAQRVTERVLILDFGAQYTQLIARRLREQHVYCEIHPCTVGSSFVRQFEPCRRHPLRRPRLDHRGGEPARPAYVFELGVPVLGICYGEQTMCAQLGGKVESGHHREFGRALITLDQPSPLFDGLLEPGDQPRSG